MSSCIILKWSNYNAEVAKWSPIQYYSQAI